MGAGELLGNFVVTERGGMVVATKYPTLRRERTPNAAGNQRKNMVQAVEASLKRLKTDYIHLFWLHIWDLLTPVDGVMRGFDDLLRHGKLLYAGISDAPAWRVAQANTMTEPVCRAAPGVQFDRAHTGTRIAAHG